MKRLLGKIVIVTRLRKLPTCCCECPYYDNMGGKPGMRNDGACAANGSYKSTLAIQVSKERLPNCPLVQVKEN